jgi:hypothetical protein
VVSQSKITLVELSIDTLKQLQILLDEGKVEQAQGIVMTVINALSSLRQEFLDV